MWGLIPPAHEGRLPNNVPVSGIGSSSAEQIDRVPQTGNSKDRFLEKQSDISKWDCVSCAVL